MTPLQEQTYSRYPSFESFIKDYAPIELLVIYAQVNTIEDSVTKIGLTLEDINTMYAKNGSMPGAYYIALWLQFLNKFSNITKPLTEFQAVSVMIYNSHKYFHLADMKVIFEKIMRSEYGTFYGSVDAQRIITSFFQYSIDRNFIKTRALSKLNSKLSEAKEKVEKEQKQIIFDELKAKGLKGDILMDEFKTQCDKRLPTLINEEALKLLSNEKKE